MVRQIIEASAAHIQLQSAAGAGSTFTIVLPLSGNGEGTWQILVVEKSPASPSP